MDSNARYSKYYTFIKPVLKNRTVRTYSSLVFSLITTTIFTLYAIKPTVSTIVSLQKSVTEQESILNQLNDKVKNLSDGRKNYQEIDDTIKVRLVTLLPDSTSIPPLVNDLTSLARVSQASISGIQFESVDLEGAPNQPSSKNSLKEIAFNVNFQGNFSKMVRILLAFQNTNRLINIRTINFSKPAEGDLVMQVSGTAYYFSNK